MASKKERLAGGDLFDEQIRQALNHFEDAAWLGKHSPLAAPYFLGEALHVQPLSGGETAVQQGKALQKALFDAAKSRLNGELPTERESFLELVNDERNSQGAKGPAYQLLLLDLKYFRHYFVPRAFPQAKNEADICEFLGVSRSSFFTHLKTARQQLGESLLSLCQPAMRLEQPPQPDSLILGQEASVEQTLIWLSGNKSVHIHGSGGSGKTTLAATVAQSWQNGPVFWYTFWPSLSDQLDSLLFSLGHFFNTQGASSLWAQLVSHGGHIEHLNTAVTHIRTDLAALNSQPLLCFDELDYLLHAPETYSQEAAQLLTLLDRLKGNAPLLLVSQDRGIVADGYVPLSGLSVAESKTLLQTVQNDISEDTVNQLVQITNGNPRLLKLCAPQLASGSIDLIELAKTVSIHSLFSALWQSMTPAARTLAQQLAVFRTPTPADAWDAQEVALTHLKNHALLQIDRQGGVRLLPIFNQLISSDPQKLPADQFEKCHLNATAVRLERGEFAAAVYHLTQAGEPEQAVQLWYLHRHQEIGRGLGSQAFATLQNISQRRLSAEGQQAMALSLAELCELLGRPEEGIIHLEQAKWPEVAMRTVDAQTLRGKFLNALGKSSDAVDAFDQSLEMLRDIAHKQVHLHTWRGFIQLQQRQLKPALLAARQAQFEAELFYGLVQEEQGVFDEAFLAYQRALALASSLEHHEGIAKANRGLANLHVRQGKEAQALDFAETAVSYFKQIDDPFNVEKVRNTIIGIYFNQGRFSEATELGEQSLQYFEAAKMPYWASITAATLSEAYYELGNDEMAKKRAYQVLTFEEPHSMPYALYTLGLVAKRAPTLPEALRFFEQAIEMATQSGDSYLKAYAERALAEAHIAQEQPQAAVPLLESALAYFGKIGNGTETAVTEKLLNSLPPNAQTS